MSGAVAALSALSCAEASIAETILVAAEVPTNTPS